MALADGSIPEVNGAPDGGVQPTIASEGITEWKDVLDTVLAQTNTPEGPIAADTILYYDSATQTIKSGLVRDMFSEAQTNAIISGEGADIDSTVSPTALPIFDTGFYSSTPSIVATAGDTGLTANISVKFKVVCTASFDAATNTDFTFQLYVNGVACGRHIEASGDGAGKFNNFTLQCITDTLNIGDEIELRVSDSGDTIDNIDADINIEFAGA